MRVHDTSSRRLAANLAGNTTAPQRWPSAGITSIGLPQKAYNIRRNPKVSMLFSERTGSGVAEPGAVLIQGDATVEDRIVSDMLSDPDVAALLETIVKRQPAGAFWSSWLGRRLMWSYYMRLMIYVTPRRALFWPTRDFTQPPEELDLREVQRVG